MIEGGYALIERWDPRMSAPMGGCVGLDRHRQTGACDTSHIMTPSLIWVGASRPRLLRVG
jgi:hypothetical protein